MESNKKIAYIGNKDSALPFLIMGVDCFISTDKISLEQALEEIIQKKYGIVYIEEALAEEIKDKIYETNKKEKEIAITIIPGARGGKELAKNNIRELVKRAVGIDILQEK